MVDDSGGDSCFRVEEGGGTACIENGGEVKVAWPEEKSQKRAMQLSKPSVACVMFLCCCRNLG